MKPQKHIKLLFVSLFMASALFSCKKLNKEETTVYFHLHNPVTNKGYSNVTVRIIEQKDVTPPLKLQSKYESKVIWEGKTDANGKASCSFKTLKSDKYTYWHSVDESFMNGKKIITQPDYGSLIKSSTTNLNYKLVVDDIKYVILYKNINCYDENDKCRFRKRNLIKPWESEWSAWMPNSPNFPNGYFEGCYENINIPSSVAVLCQDAWEVEYEVIRNGVTTTFKDTLYIIGNNTVDTLKYFY